MCDQDLTPVNRRTDTAVTLSRVGALTPRMDMVQHVQTRAEDGLTGRPFADLETQSLTSVYANRQQNWNIWQISNRNESLHNW